MKDQVDQMYQVLLGMTHFALSVTEVAADAAKNPWKFREWAGTLANLIVDEDASPVVIYFAVLGGALGVVVVECLKETGKQGLQSLALGVASLVLAFVSLFVCWGAIFRFMMATSVEMGCGLGKSPAELLFCSTSEWKNHDVFVQAYVDVCSTSVGWQSSSQLLMFVLSGCTFLHLECKRRNVSGLVAACYVIVGFLGAISVAFPILFARLYVVRSQIYGKFASLNSTLVVCNVLALLSVVLLPLTFKSHRQTLFRNALLLVHFILGIPAFIGRPYIAIRNIRLEKAKVAAFYAFLAGVSLMLHVQNTLRVVLENGGCWKTALTTIAFGPFKMSECQYSISFDVVFTSFAAGMYMLLSNPKIGFLCVCLTPILSIAVTFPFFLCLDTLGMIEL